MTVALIVPVVLDHVVLPPLLGPVEAGGSEFLRVRDKQQFDLQLDADFTRDGELGTRADRSVARGEHQEVDIRANLAVNAELNGYDGKVETETRKCLDGHAQSRVKQHGAGSTLVAECYFQICVEADFKRDERRIGSAEESLTPFVFTFDVGAHVAAAERDVPVAVRNADTCFENDGAVEVE